MPLIRSIGALAFIVGVALLALDGARSFKVNQFEVTSLERFWTNIGADSWFSLRMHLADWLGDMSDQVLDLPAAFIAFGLGMALMVMADAGSREVHKRPLVL
jgi:hypothetical protein